MQSNDAAITELTECPDAYKNPVCPYVTQINYNTGCMKQVEKALAALLGEDGTGLNGGVIHKILTKLEDQNECNETTKSWLSVAKPVFVYGVIAVFSAVLSYWFAKGL